MIVACRIVADREVSSPLPKSNYKTHAANLEIPKFKDAYRASERRPCA